MECCRLCLQSADVNILDCAESLRILQNFFPRLSRSFAESPMLCETCMDNTRSVKTLMKNVNETAAKIEINMTHSSLGKLDLRTLCEKNPRIPENISICRVCLKIIGKARIFLYDNNVNLLQQDIIKSMLKFCDIFLNFEVSENPLMCIDCWQLLQASYSFKKDYLEAERKIRLYCSVFRIKPRKLHSELLHKINLYFNEDVQSHEQSLKNDSDLDKNISTVNIGIKEDLDSPSLKVVIKEDPSLIKKERPGLLKINQTDLKKRRKHIFTADDDKILMKIYYEVTKVEEDLKFGYWKKLQDEWKKLSPTRPLNYNSIRRRVIAILNQTNQKIPSEKEIKEIKSKVREEMKLSVMTTTSIEETITSRRRTRNLANRTKVIQPGFSATLLKKNNNSSLESGNDVASAVKDNANPKPNIDKMDKAKEIDYEQKVAPLLDREVHSDSDDSFVDEAAHSSFTPHIKSEPLSDNDDEINIIEPNVIERNFSTLMPQDDSDDDSLPTLERMDIPPMQIKIQDFYSVDVKREALNMFTNDGEIDPQLVVEDLKTCRRISLGKEDTGLFKCMQCSFETKYRFCADRHSKWHGNSNKKLYDCKLCSYRISNRLVFKQHMKNHNDDSLDNDIPVLHPFTMK
ncbi:hypothetical protein JTB14_009151 [Gonioctena quinquepunctata]|nr:hypothetical protein JTB14_009151 [Gonioctena quinquepunctata]